MTHGETTSSPPPAGADELGKPGAQYLVRLDNFEGPLDLLLHLIQQHELDILDIPIAFIAERYVAYVTLMEELNIDVASEYLLMAATLIHIKSKLLLPTPPADQEDAEAESELDPRADLIRRLLEYQKYKDAANQLGSRSVVGRDVFGRGSVAPAADEPAPLAQVGLFKLLDAFQQVLNRVDRKLDHQIEFERLSITERINEIVDLLRVRPRCEFTDLFTDQRTRMEVITTFLALLEMTRLRMTRLTQEGPLAPIFVEACLGDAPPVEPLGELGPLPVPAAAEPESVLTELADAEAPAAADVAAAEPEGDFEEPAAADVAAAESEGDFEEPAADDAVATEPEVVPDEPAVAEAAAAEPEAVLEEPAVAEAAAAEPEAVLEEPAVAEAAAVESEADFEEPAAAVLDRDSAREPDPPDGEVAEVTRQGRPAEDEPLD